MAKRKVLHPEWDKDTDPFEIKDAVEGRTITVNRRIAGREQIAVRKVKKIGRVRRDNGSWTPSTLHFLDGYNGAHRAVRLVDIVEVR